MGEKVETYTDTVLCDDGLHAKKMRKPLFQNATPLEMENGEHKLIEVTMKRPTIPDDKPLIMAKTILQNSKLHFLKFVYEVLWKYFIPKSFKLNYCDTDSLCICKFLYH